MDKVDYEALVDALHAVSQDMHNTSLRPCATCGNVSKALGEPFGCVAFQERHRDPHKHSHEDDR